MSQSDRPSLETLLETAPLFLTAYYQMQAEQLQRRLASVDHLNWPLLRQTICQELNLSEHPDPPQALGSILLWLEDSLGD